MHLGNGPPRAPSSLHLLSSPTLHNFTRENQLLNDQEYVINCFLVIGFAEFLCSKAAQIRHAFTSSQTLTNLNKEHINDTQLRIVISLALLAACYQFERWNYWNQEDMFK